MTLVDWIGAWPGAVLLQRSGTIYLFVNAAHIASIGLLIGGILPLDLRLAGLIRGVPLAVIAPFLARSAAIGLGLAIVTGLWLFSVKPREYLANTAFLWKMALLALALLNIAVQHRNRHFRLALDGGTVHPSVRLVAGCSAILWLSVLVAGRWVGFL
ncbi:DUF6644 family protein [Reyranella soli]|uniref:DUF6644 domain-containing protein n=1 Tax=Reyranella soli TaxID=1230389 RepID=A0A512NRW9_9HYPH|nr:DUF6644 family protein [Reyranella soli]GEP61691.1 hypothetical protein RSO01_88570 [Reyranella soli]